MQLLQQIVVLNGDGKFLLVALLIVIILIKIVTKKKEYLKVVVTDLHHLINVIKIF
jgi:hypothetical protein